MITVDSIVTTIDQAFPTIVKDLVELVAIPSVSAGSHDQAQVQRSAEHVAGLLRETGADQVEILSAAAEDGTPGRPAVVARFDGPAGAPRVLLYAHHDVQPVGNPDKWHQDDPFTAVERDGRLYGRGTADDGAGVMTHVHSLRALRSLGEMPCSVTVFIEGEEEVGSPSFSSFLETYRDKLEADVIVVADSNNWAVGTPALTTSLRGQVQADVSLRVLDHALHSGGYGGPIIDANLLMCRLLSSLHDEAGDVAVPGLLSTPTSAAGAPTMEEADFRRDAGVLEGVELVGRGDLTARLWTKPSITLIGMDITSLDLAGNVIAPACTARLSMRIAPGQEPHEAFEALRSYLTTQVPWGAQLEVTLGEAGPAFAGSADTPAAEAAHWALTTAWGQPSVNIGQGGSIPFISTLQRTFPQAQVLVTGVEDPDSRPHGEDESMHLGELKRCVTAEALLLAQLGGQIEG